MTTAVEGGDESASRPGRFLTPGKDPVPIVQEAGWVPGPVWTGAENHPLTRIRSPDRPARSQSLYRLRYPAHERDVTYLHELIPWSRVLLEELTSSQLVKKFPAFYGTQKFITAFTRARYLSLS